MINTGYLQLLRSRNVGYARLDVMGGDKKHIQVQNFYLYDMHEDCWC
jgi:hypothetical protein